MYTYGKRHQVHVNVQSHHCCLEQIDGTAPVTGAFAVETEHRASLTRHRAGWMTYDDSTIRLAWLGFSDAYCPVTSYYLTVGRKLGSSDLLVYTQCWTTEHCYVAVNVRILQTVEDTIGYYDILSGVV